MRRSQHLQRTGCMIGMSRRWMPFGLTTVLIITLLFSRTGYTITGLSVPNATGNNTELSSGTLNDASTRDPVEETEQPKETAGQESYNHETSENSGDNGSGENERQNDTYSAENTEDPDQSHVTITKFDTNGLQLRIGIANEEVLRIKKFLVAKGYTQVVENYYYDGSIRDMVADYQSKNGLIADGIIGKNTYAKINEDMEANGIVIHSVSLSFANEVPNQSWIIINLSSNTLYYLDGETVLDSYPVATGKKAGYTPQGKFTVVTKYANPAWGGAGRQAPVAGGAPSNPLGKRWMGLSIKGGDVYGIHGNADESSIGKYISLGCIRMSNKGVVELFNMVKIGTPVQIGTQETLNNNGIIFH